MKRFFLVASSITAFLMMAATNNLAPVQASDSQAAFFANIKQLCGRSFEGATIFPRNPDHPLVGKRLVITVDACGEKEIRIPFQVGEDRSRTWVLRLAEKGLLLKHDHRHADGTPDEVTMYGGWADPDGTPHRQRFPADSETKELIPEAATNVWMIEIDEKRQELVYYLERHKEPRYRAVFKLIPIKK
ncbi:MAG TPA: hypothetical protein VIG62_04500 [Blastocatellia bacterium]|jgi:hypothetical protein